MMRCTWLMADGLDPKLPYEYCGARVVKDVCRGCGDAFNVHVGAHPLCDDYDGYVCEVGHRDSYEVGD